MPRITDDRIRAAGQRCYVSDDKPIFADKIVVVTETSIAANPALHALGQFSGGQPRRSTAGGYVWLSTTRHDALDSYLLFGIEIEVEELVRSASSELRIVAIRLDRTVDRGGGFRRYAITQESSPRARCEPAAVDVVVACTAEKATLLRIQSASE